MAELDEGIQDWAELEQMLRARWPLSSADADLAERRDVARRVAGTDGSDHIASPAVDPATARSSW